MTKYEQTDILEKVMNGLYLDNHRKARKAKYEKYQETKREGHIHYDRWSD